MVAICFEKNSTLPYGVLKRDILYIEFALVALLSHGLLHELKYLEKINISVHTKKTMDQYPSVFRQDARQTSRSQSGFVGSLTKKFFFATRECDKLTPLEYQDEVGYVTQ